MDAVMEFYPDGSRPIARGLEFATQPFDVPRREVIQTNTVFDTPTYAGFRQNPRLIRRSCSSIREHLLDSAR